MQLKEVKEKVKRPLVDLTDEQVLQLVRDYLEWSANASMSETLFRELSIKYCGDDTINGLLGFSFILLTELCFRFNNRMTLEQLMN
jgi:hypothetical protein